MAVDGDLPASVTASAACGMPNICGEPCGVPKKPNWTFVGPGAGEYDKLQQFSFVGDNEGSFEKEVVTTYAGWRLKRPALVLLVAGVLVLAVALTAVVLAVIPQGVEQVPEAEKAFHCEIASANLQAEWTQDKKAYCCLRTGLGCGASPTIYVGAPPAQVIGQPPVVRVIAPPAAPAVVPFGQPQAAYRAPAAPPLQAMTGPPRCDIPCTYMGETHTCVDRIHFAATNAGQVVAGPQQCSDSYQRVMSECPVCEHGCTLQASGCMPGGARWPAQPLQSASAPVQPYYGARSQGGFDCQAGLPVWESDWSSGKKAWCCVNERKGCYEPRRFDCDDETEMSTWSTEQRSWCCSKERKGCLLSGDVTLK